MRLFVSGATATLRRHPGSPYLGALIVPAAGNRLAPVLAAGLPWAADNAAFSGFNPAAFCAMLARLAGQPGCRFVACPDVVADASATAESFRLWAPLVAALGLPVGLVLQDEQDRVGVPWDHLDAVFVGGSTEFKLGPLAASLVSEAKRRGKWVHLGRCNTRKRFRYAFQLGCDSVDGSGFSRWPDQRVPLALTWLGELHGTVDHARPDPATRAFFRGGLGGGLLAGSGWRVHAVRETPSGYEVEASFGGEPRHCQVCCRAAPVETRLAGHGTRSVTVIDQDRAGRPVRVRVTRQRYRCEACGSVFTLAVSGLALSGRLSANAVRSVAPEETAVATARRLGVCERTVRRHRERSPEPVSPLPK